MPNQYKPLPPEIDLKPIIELYYHMGLSDINIARRSIDHFDKDTYGLGVKSVKRMRKKWGLTSTRQQKHTIETIAEDVAEIKRNFPNSGADAIKKTLMSEKNIRVPREVVLSLLKEIEPEAVMARRYRKKEVHVTTAMGSEC